MTKNKNNQTPFYKKKNSNFRGQCIYLKKFNKEFKKLKTQKGKIDKLLEATKHHYKFLAVGYFLRRKIFRGVKKTQCNCKVCGKKTTTKHHIILLKDGGLNEKINLMPICYDCHKKVHPWIRKIELKPHTFRLDKKVFAKLNRKRGYRSWNEFFDNIG